MIAYSSVSDHGGPKHCRDCQSAQAAVIEELAYLVDGVSRYTNTTPEAVLAGISDELLFGFFLTRVRRMLRGAGRAG